MGRAQQNVETAVGTPSRREAPPFRGPVLYDVWKDWPLGDRQSRKLRSILKTDPTMTVLGLDEQSTVRFSVPVTLNRHGEFIAARGGKITATGECTWRHHK